MIVPSRRDVPLDRPDRRAALPWLQPLDRRRRNFCRWALVAPLGAWFLLACGVQGPVEPPRVERPERVTDLAASQIGRAVELSFTLPALATDGERLSKPVEIDIFRSVTLEGQAAPSPAASSRPWASLMATDLKQYTNGAKIVYVDHLSEQEFTEGIGSKLTFTLQAVTRGFRQRPITSELSNNCRTSLLDVSLPVRNVAVHPTEKALELTWSQPDTSLGNRPLRSLSGYHIYRSTTGKSEPFKLLGESPSASYADTNFVFDRSYTYRVRAVFREDSVIAESEDSESVEFTPHDVFPPAVPVGLSGLYTAQGAELIWTANSEPDLAGYNVYRREQTAPPVRLNRELLRAPIFRDATATSGKEYFYHVTAVDLAGNESSGSTETLVETR